MAFLRRHIDLATSTIEEREEFMKRVYDEAVEYRQGSKDSQIIRAFRLWRALPDKHTPFKSDLTDTYAWAATAAIHAALYPVPLSSDPPFQIQDPNPANKERNDISERLLSAQLRNPQYSNFKLANDKIILDLAVFGTTCPWVFFKSQTRPVGPFFQNVVGPNGDPAINQRGEFIVEERYENIRTHHGPWIEHTDLWDTYIHPDGRRIFIIRDTNGYELLRQSEGANPIYDKKRINRMIVNETKTRIAQQQMGGGFTAGDTNLQLRDQLALEAGALPIRQYIDIHGQTMDDVLGRPYTIVHYDDGDFSGSFALTDTGLFMELRWFRGNSPDGQGNIIKVGVSPTPGEVYDVGIIELHEGILRAHSRFFQAGLDGASLTVNPMWAISEQLRMNQGEMVVGPGFTLAVPIGAGERVSNHIERLDMPQTWIQAMSVADQLKARADMGFGQGDPQRGIAAGGRKTAFETNVVAEAAGGRIRMLNERIMNQWYIPLIQKISCMNSIHLTREDLFKALGPLANDYNPPTVQEIVESLLFVPRGSLESSDKALKASRWPQILQLTIQAMPFFQNEAFRELYMRALEDLGVENPERLTPSADDPTLTQFQVMSGQGGQASLPRSPTDLTPAGSRQAQGAFGSLAPPGPIGGGGANGSART